MAAPKKKRRTSAPQRKRAPARAPAIEKDEWFRWVSPGTWALETLCVLCMVAAIFILTGVLSHKLAVHPSQNPELGLLPQRNVMGPIGHFVATLLTGMIGWCALIPAIWLALFSYHLWNRAHPGEGKNLQIASPPLALFGVGLSMFITAALASVFWGATGGGQLGGWLAKPLLLCFGWGGALLFSCAALLLSFGLIFQRSSFDVLNQGLRAAGTSARIVFWNTPLAIFFLISDIFIAACRALGRALHWMFGPMESDEADEMEDELPKPKRRKNAICAEESRADIAAEPHEEEQYEVIVTRRGKHEALTKSLAGKSRKLERNKTPAKEESPDGYPPYDPPPLSLLKPGSGTAGHEDDDELKRMSALIEAKLRDFSILGRVTQVHPGPVITLFEFEPAAGVKVGRITSLQDDLAMSLRASAIRIIAPIPGRGTVGIEVPNRQREFVRLRDVLESEAFVTAESCLSVPLGKDTYGDPVVVDIASMPHLLMAGATGTGKSVCINAILVSLLYRAAPSELGLILIDPKILELSVYEGVPHLRVPVVTVPKQAKAVLEWAVREMDRRYRLMQRYGVRSIDGFNALVRGEPEEGTRPKPVLAENVVELDAEKIIEEGEPGETAIVEAAEDAEVRFTEELKPLPKIVIVIDELADLMLSVGREIEDLITRLAQKARAAGLHLIVATQRPSVDVITGLIKANFPARISFRVSSRIDSRTILDAQGAEKLLGRGDLLLMRPGAQHVQRAHGAFVSDTEVTEVVSALRRQGGPRYDQEIIQVCEKALQEDSEGGSGDLSMETDYDAFYDQAVALVIEKGQASTSMLQRAFRIGYNRAARIIDTMEAQGVIGPMDGVKPREVLVASMDLDQG